MTPDEARSVMWLRNNYKPIGELLDKGDLTRKDLEWAVAKAYDPKIKQAAQILLAYQNHSSSIVVKPDQSKSSPTDVTFSSDISISEARATVWPFGQFKGQPMGELADSQQISLRDLAYAVENARDKRVRQAAVALTLVRLEQVVTEPEPPTGFLHVITGGRSFSQRRQFQLTLFEGMLLGFALGICVVLFIQSLPQINVQAGIAEFNILFASPAGKLGFITAILLCIAAFAVPSILLDKTLDRVDKQIINHRKGEQGEDRVVTVMSQALDGNWYLFRNVYLPGRDKADLDCVLVGSCGVWVLETKAYTGEFRNIGDKWEILTRKGWKVMRKNPSKQAQRNAAHLGNFLRADGIQQWINPAVIWANPESKIIAENPMVAVWPLDRLPEALGNLQGKAIPDATRQQIIDKLTKLCETQKAAPSTDAAETTVD